MLDLSVAKNFLKVEHDEDDELISMYINTAEEYLKSACGDNVNTENPKAQTIMLMLISEYYENRTVVGHGNYSSSICSMITQLRLETEMEDAT